MEIRDVIQGSIKVSRTELPIIDSRYFQRLRGIRQLGFGENSYPSATHNRYIHSLGAMTTATQAFDTIFGGPDARASQFASDRLLLARHSRKAWERFRAVTRLAAVLHDVGHGPLSHTTEFAMPDVRKLGVPGYKGGARKANHEDYTLKIILDSGLTPLLKKAGSEYGFTPEHVAALIDKNFSLKGDFFVEKIEGQKVNFRPILQQLISSELDADRMDYLRRDSWYAGVSYGQFDYDWLVGNLTSHIREDHCFLAIQHRALFSFEDFLISRFHMFLMVYFHYKAVVFDEMLGQYFASPDCDYALPSDIEEYCACDDSHLYSHLAKSQNPFAKRISEKRPYRVLIELHSGIPATKMAETEQQRLLNKLQKQLEAEGVHYIVSTSTSELSKYFKKPGDPIYVRYDNHYSAPAYIPLEKCTDLFERYREKRSITRLYVSPEDLPRFRAQGRSTPLPYDEDHGQESLPI